MPYESMTAETVHLNGHEGDQIDGYLARPQGAGPHPGVVVIHHMPGWDSATKEIARRFAHEGYAAISPNLQFREGKGDPDANSASVREAGGMPDNRTLGDLEAAIAYLKSQPYCNGKIGIIGYCSGGRQSYLSACKLAGLDAAVVCYGGGIVCSSDELTERQPVAPIDYTADVSCPILGLFGKEDQRPSPADVAAIDEALKKHGKSYEFHSYDNAGHSFFAVDRDAYRVHAATDGWQKILGFYGKHLS